jgi:uncharacterized DUF497 family protein
LPEEPIRRHLSPEAPARKAAGRRLEVALGFVGGMRSPGRRYNARVQIVDVYATEWVLEKLASKHSVTIEEVQEVLLNESRRIFGARERSYLALGQTAAGRYLAVFFFVEGAAGGVSARVATARDMDDAERRRFARK